jgi:hypothetical protein
MIRIAPAQVDNKTSPEAPKSAPHGRFRPLEVPNPNVTFVVYNWNR